jgi:hypothetical protein
MLGEVVRTNPDRILWGPVDSSASEWSLRDALLKTGREQNRPVAQAMRPEENGVRIKELFEKSMNQEKITLAQLEGFLFPRL